MLQQILNNMLLIPGSDFRPVTEKKVAISPENEGKPQEVLAISSFYLSRFPVTQGEWEWLMGNNPSFTGYSSDCPVENVSWCEVQEFILRLNACRSLTFRLPCEAEWEYAAQGGNTVKNCLYCGSDDADAVAWHAGNANRTTHPVGLKKPNSLGLYDMSGNVSEWCSDVYKLKAPPRALFYTDPLEYIAYKEWLKQETMTYRVLRGGDWMARVENCMVKYRGGLPEDLQSMQAGFRLAADY